MSCNQYNQLLVSNEALAVWCGIKPAQAKTTPFSSVNIWRNTGWLVWTQHGEKHVCYVSLLCRRCWETVDEHEGGTVNRVSHQFLKTHL